MKNFARRISIVVAAGAVSIGLLGISAPAQAKDSSWGYLTGTSAGSTSTLKDSSWGW